MPIPWKRLTVLCLMCLSVLPQSSLGQAANRKDRTGIKDKAAVFFGGFIVNFNTRGRFDDIDDGSDLNLEDILGLENRKFVFRLGGFWRFNQRHRVRFEWMRLGRDGSVRLEDNLDLGDVILPEGVGVESDFVTGVYKAAYQFAIVNNGHVEVGVSAGLSVFDFRSELRGVGLPGDVEPVDLRSVVAPVPVFGGYVNWTLRPRLFLRGNGEYFTLNIGDREGELVDLGVGLHYHFNEQFGVSVGYDYLDIRYIDGSERFFADYRYSGIIVGAQVSF